MRVRHHHHLVHSQLVDGHDETAHGRVEGRDNQAAGVLDDFGIAVAQPQGGGQQLGEPCVHVREHGQLLVGIFVGEVLLIAFRGHELFVEC